ncbi:restriction endonuclease subunit S [Desulfurivibrio alkaliphilus]|uniref:Restriction modification system DNA specificity domain protein n=1 Tax=Desulfurivibrio alkaliphilus (strain DSM 19089 / UNIQEM U267 / AHT2) TaxID=589865 RepID=D6Z5F9_DESAT|nr:restriction endonuclease subunit S [Desulfurivibrio alkaliphilus]ADH86696.1 restriction modification system DNA specificity domain protein [Desulfurivibrio alkaliphilus AHT 2]
MELKEASPEYLAQQAAQVPKGYKLTEVGVIPEDWELAPLGKEVEQLEAGVSVNSVDEDIRSYAHYQAILKTSAVIGGRFLPHENKKIAPRDIGRARLNPRFDTIIISRMNTPDLVGECGYVFADFPNLFLPDRLWMTHIRSGSKVNVRWLNYLLSSRPYKSQIKELATGTSGSMKNIAKDSLLAMPVAYPPPLEQRAIAAALTDVDALLAKLDQLIAKKRDLKQATMQQLLTGQTRLPSFSGEWETKLLGEIGDFIKGKGVSRDQAQSGRLPCVRYGEIYTIHNDLIREFHSWISKEVAETATSLKSGDLLFAGSGETKEEIGKCVAFIDDTEAYAGGDIVVLRPRSVNSIFLGYALNSPAVNRQKASLGQGDAVVHISAKALADITIFLPGDAEQTAIAAVLSDMDAEIAALERRREKTRFIKQGMMQELLTGRIRFV